jgi:hypothetical protein
MKNEGDVVCYLGNGCPIYRNYDFQYFLKINEGQQLLQELFSLSRAQVWNGCRFLKGGSEIYDDVDERRMIHLLLHERMEIISSPRECYYWECLQRFLIKEESPHYLLPLQIFHGKFSGYCWNFLFRFYYEFHRSTHKLCHCTLLSRSTDGCSSDKRRINFLI